MNGVAFPEAMGVLTKPEGWTDEQCYSLPVYRDSERSLTVSCWKMSWAERFSSFLFGRVWLFVHAGGETQPPVALIATRDAFKEVGDS